MDLAHRRVEDLAHRRVEDLAHRRGDLHSHEVGTGLQPCPLGLLPPSDSPITSPPNHNNLAIRAGAREPVAALSGGKGLTGVGPVGTMIWFEGRT